VKLRNYIFEGLRLLRLESERKVKEVVAGGRSRIENYYRNWNREPGKGIPKAYYIKRKRRKWEGESILWNASHVFPHLRHSVSVLGHAILITRSYSKIQNPPAFIAQSFLFLSKLSSRTEE